MHPKFRIRYKLDTNVKKPQRLHDGRALVRKKTFKNMPPELACFYCDREPRYTCYSCAFFVCLVHCTGVAECYVCHDYPQGEPLFATTKMSGSASSSVNPVSKEKQNLPR